MEKFLIFKTCLLFLKVASEQHTSQNSSWFKEIGSRFNENRKIGSRKWE